MKHPALLLLLWTLTSCLAWSQTKAQSKSMRSNPSAYALYQGDGTPATWSDLVTEALEADVVCFGELHDDAVMHWLQQELVRSLLDHGAQPCLGAEMLEADDQLVVNEYLAGVVNLDKLEAAANLWPNHATDYQPLLDLAKEHGLTMTATNV
ncbi:MAG: ChaN family lipoprotein, partial [Flavobacteriales bacterium]